MSRLRRFWTRVVLTWRRLLGVELLRWDSGRGRGVRVLLVPGFYPWRTRIQQVRDLWRGTLTGAWPLWSATTRRRRTQ